MITYQNCINGKWVAPHSGQYSVVTNPANINDTYAKAPLSDEQDVADAIAACVAAERKWAETPAPVRGRILYKLADLLEADVDKLAEILTREEGKTFAESRGEVLHSATECRYMAGEAFRLTGKTYPSELAGGMVCHIREPIGTIAAINPWNYPVVTPIRKIAPALACGDTVLFKPAQNTPGTAVRLMELFAQAGVPDGVVNLICGSGSKIGDIICDSPDVKGISFTGSTAVGRHIAERAGRRVAKLQLEMGGKNPAIVWNPPDMAFCADQIAKSAFGGAGQKCTAISKVLVKADQEAELVRLLCEQAKKLVVGNGLESGTTLGPLATKQQFDTVTQYMRLAKETATVAFGCETPEKADGYYVSPTIVTGIDRHHRLAKEEVFGPFLSVIAVESIDEAIEAANDVEYGLASAIFSSDAGAIREYVRRIQSGMAHVNEQTLVMGHVPFGGVKNSGFGAYSNGDTAKDFYMNDKVVYFA